MMSLALSISTWSPQLTYLCTAYKAYFLGMAKVSNAFAMSNILSAMGILAIIFNSLIVVRFGSRRNIMMIGLVFCGLLQLIIAVVYDKNPGQSATGKVLVALTCLYMMSYNVSTLVYLFFRCLT